MRIISSLFFILWLLLGWWSCNNYNDCCDQSDRNSVVKQVNNTVVVPIVNETIKKGGPLLFNKASENPILGSQWTTYRDSISHTIDKDHILEIKGHYYADEQNHSKYKNLGLARANAIAKNFYKSIPKENIRLTSQLVSGEHIEPFISASFRSLMNNKNIKEIDNKTLIYFPFNSTKKLNNTIVENYLNTVVQKANRTNSKVKLVGHTDNIGSHGSNYNLGLKRANIVKDYLIRKGLSPSRILATSKGEKKPVATNDTDKGRAKNRRTELLIIK